MVVATLSPERVQYRTADAGETLSNSLIQTMSSELSTPLNIMMGYASLLNEGALGELTPEQKSAITSIVARADGMRAIVNRLNILMEAETGLGEFVPLNFSNILKQVLASKSEKITEAGLSLQSPDFMQRYNMLGDSTQLTELVNSLLNNAIKYTPQGGQISVSLEAKDNFLQIFVEDTGIGIPENLLEEIFTSLHTNDKALNNRLGLGLSIVRAVARRHGGDVIVESQPGMGSRFAVSLPLVSVSAVDAASLVPPVKHRILVVDDDESVAFTLQHAILKVPNCEVTVANSGEEALRYYAQENFDLVFTDYKMPNMNGIELSQAMRVINPGATIILISAYYNSILREDAEKLEVHGYLKKPLDIKDIRATVKRVLKQKENA